MRAVSPPAAIETSVDAACATASERLVWAPSEAVFDVLTRVGQQGRYPGGLVDQTLWTLRTIAAPVIVRGGRRDDGGLRPSRLGDEVDHWRVVACTQSRSFALACPMRGLGEARIEWSIEDRPGARSLLRQTASIVPFGPLGRLYWWLTRPPHAFVFSRLVRGIALAAERDHHVPAGRPRDGLRIIRREITVPGEADETFAFFADPRNLEAITPAWLRFEILTPMPIPMGEGTHIDYRIRLHGFPVRWHTRIDAWEPGYRFVDRQVRGPYRWWHHEHRFERADGGTRVIDEVEYASPLRWISEPILVRRDLNRIFDERMSRLRSALGSPVAKENGRCHAGAAAQIS